MASRLKIGLVYDAVYPVVLGGAERRFYEIGRRLAQEHEVHLISWSYHSTEKMDGMLFRGLGPAPELHGANGRRRLLEAAHFGTKLALFLSRERFDVIDCCSIPYSSVYVASGLRKDSALVATWHEFLGDGWEGYMPRAAPFLAKIESGSARLGAHRVAVSEFTQSRLPPGPPTTVIPNGVDLEAIDCARKATDAPSILFVGRLMPHKRLELALEALTLTPKETTMAIVGTGPDEDRLKRQTTALDLEGRVAFSSRLDRGLLLELMKGATVLVQPSGLEGQSIVVREAMGCGLPAVVVTGSHTGASRNIIDGETGLIAEPTVAGIAKALNRILLDKELREHLSRNAIRASQGFDWSVVSESTASLYTGMT
jgi:glycosyltransferase involved in cell wall biosynthesis